MSGKRAERTSHRRAGGAQVGARGRAGVHAAAARARVREHGTAEPPARARGHAIRRGAGAAVCARGRGREPAAAAPGRIGFVRRQRALCWAPGAGRPHRARPHPGSRSHGILQRWHAPGCACMQQSLGMYINGARHAAVQRCFCVCCDGRHLLQPLISKHCASMF